jgi:ribosomal-protein-alanine N-acetyltransferase
MALHPRQRRIEIVPMRVGDLDDVMEIERQAHRSPWTRQVFIEELDRDWARLMLIKERRPAGSRTVAFCNYWLVRDEVHILNVATHPDERRRGHARRLLEHIVEFAVRHGCRYVTLEVRRGNLGAVKLYRQFGFRPVGIRPRYYAEDAEDAVVMLLELGAAKRSKEDAQ